MMVLRRFAAVISKLLINFNAAVRCGGSAAVAVVPCNSLTSFNAAVCGGCMALTPIPPCALRGRFVAPRGRIKGGKWKPSERVRRLRRPLWEGFPRARHPLRRHAYAV
jgi:hypothetical protein